MQKPEGALGPTFALKFMARRKLSRGPFFRMAVDILEELNGVDDLLFEVLHQGSRQNELFCISMLYDIFFDLDSWSVEKIIEMFGFLEFGMSQNFWLSFYQASDLYEKLQASKFKGQTDWATDKSQDMLLRLARRHFKKIPVLVSDLGLRDIDEKRFVIWKRLSGGA